MKIQSIVEVSRFPRREHVPSDMGKTKSLSIEQVLKLPTHRLLAYYKALRKSVNQSEASSHWEEGDTDSTRSMMTKIKAELDTRENV